jgi:anti-sigma factor RsiW
MQHLSEGELQAHLDGELEAGHAAVCRGHLSQCPVCRRALAVVRARGDRVTGLLRKAAIRPVPKDRAS